MLLTVYYSNRSLAIAGIPSDPFDSAQFHTLKKDVLGALSSHITGYSSLLEDCPYRIETISKPLFLALAVLGERLYHRSLGIDITEEHGSSAICLLLPTDADFVLLVARAVQTAYENKNSLTITITHFGMGVIPEFWVELIAREVLRYA
jgi:hypothetical protein